MNAPHAGPMPGHRSKQDVWIVQFLFVAAVAYTLSVVMVAFGYLNISTRVVAFVLLLILAVKSMFVMPKANPYTGRAFVLMFSLFALAIFNSTISWDPLQTTGRWIFWFILVTTLTRLGRTQTAGWFDLMIKYLPFMFSMIYFAYIYLARTVDSEVIDDRLSYHMSGLYGNLVLATGLFAPKLWQRGFWVLVGLLGVFFSGAGGALFTVPIMFVPFILYSTSSMPVKGAVIAAMLLVGLAIFFESELFTRFLDIKVGISSSGHAQSYSGMDRLMRSKEGRLALARYGLGLANENPLGTGLGKTYYEVIKQEIGIVHVHDGTISLLIELGYFGFALYAGIFAWVLLMILTNPGIKNHYKGFYFTYLFTIMGRSLTENYTIFDLGNFFNMVLLLVTIYLFFYPRTRHTQAAYSGHPPFAGALRPPPRPPFMRAPMPARL